MGTKSDEDDDYNPDAEQEQTTKAKQKKNKKNKTPQSSEDALAEMNRLKQHHRDLLADGCHCVVGVDEAGRGPLAGPVVVAAAYVPIDVAIAGITDSKKINDEEEREELYEIIIANDAIKWSVSVLNHEIIDEFNILEASMIGMRQCVQQLHDQIVAQKVFTNGVDYALCDGNRDPWKYAPNGVYPSHLKYEAVTKGDAKIYCVGAASIIAKVTRDRLMATYDAQYPQYKWLENKGYPTPFHKSIVLSQGPSPIHRKTFRPVSTWYEKNDPQTLEKWKDLKAQRTEERKQLWAKKQGNVVKKKTTKKKQVAKKKKNVKAKKKKAKKKKRQVDSESDDDMMVSSDDD